MNPLKHLHTQLTTNLRAGALVGLLATAMLLGGCPDDENNTPSNNSNNPNKCQNLCLENERKCDGDSTVLTCVKNEEGCFDFGDPQDCPGNRVCMAGMCVTQSEECSDLCQAGSFRCNRQGESQECIDSNNDGCFEYGDPQKCDDGKICNQDNGQCEAVQCNDECTEGEVTCEGDLIKTCRKDAAGCLAYGPAKDCPDNKTCQNNDCVAPVTCEDECIDGEKLCGPGGTPRTCRDGDNNGCVEYVDEPACGNGEECRGGECKVGSSCQDQCTPGSKACSVNQIQECRDTDNDGCVEFDIPQDCPNATETCDNSTGVAVCKAAPMSGKVVINEVFYDALVDEVDSQGRAPTFIELRGPAGLTLASYEIKLINGSNGMEYGKVTLPADAKLDGKGLAVITLDKPDNFLNFAPTNVYALMVPYANGQDGLQNGPDNVELYDGSASKVDAVGYGTFGANRVFTGEGMPAEDVYRGRSLGRKPGGIDTDDNSKDFFSYFPTPGLENSDLIINEIYVDQPGADGVVDQMETFIELAAPIQGWVDIELEGYVLQAINGNDGKDYIFTGQLDGIVLSQTTPHAKLGNDGMVVICNLGVTNSLLSLCEVVYDGVDYQNGPDSFVLTYRGRVIDAVGYGSFGANDVFRGEGSAATFTRADSGKSLSRWPIRDPSKTQDTDDNSKDFYRVAPTPGRGNTLPNP